MSAMWMVRSPISFVIVATIVARIMTWAANAANDKHTYTVCAGDCSWTIASRYGIPVDALRKANRLSGNAKLHPRQKLVIPTTSHHYKGSSSTSRSTARITTSHKHNTPAPYRIHVVRKGECAYTIAKKWGIPLRTLLMVNGLREENKLRPGQRLRIPISAKLVQASMRQNRRGWIASSTAQRTKAFVIASNVNIRSSPSIRARRLGKAQRGMWGWVLARKGAWYKLALDGHPKRIVGWIRGDLLKMVKVKVTASSVVRSLPTAGLITAYSVRLRNKPSLRARILKLLHKGERVTIIGSHGGWYKVRMQGKTGWVSGQYVKAELHRGSEVEVKLTQAEGKTANSNGKNAIASPQTAGDSESETPAAQASNNESSVIAANEGTSSDQPQVEQPISNSSSKVKQAPDKAQVQDALNQSLVRAARRYLGVRYRRGSSYPSRGFDCSGFVYYLLRRHGIIAPRTTSELFRIGKPVPKSQLRPGDLVFFHNTYRRGISHVGIYIGNGKFIHASSSRRRVIITPLNSKYYAKRYAGARRVTKR